MQNDRYVHTRYAENIMKTENRKFLKPPSIKLIEWSKCLEATEKISQKVSFVRSLLDGTFLIVLYSYIALHALLF